MHMGAQDRSLIHLQLPNQNNALTGCKPSWVFVSGFMFVHVHYQLCILFIGFNDTRKTVCSIHIGPCHSAVYCTKIGARLLH